MRNITGQPVSGGDLFGRDREIQGLWWRLEEGGHVLMLGPRGVGKSSIMQALWRRPVRDWDAVYADLGAATDIGTCLATLLAAFVSHPTFRPWVRRIPFRGRLAQALEAAEKGMLPTLVVPTLRSVIGGEWRKPAARLQGALARLPDVKRRLLIVLDELPLVLGRILVRGEAQGEAAAFGQWLQTLLRDGTLSARVRFVIGGSGGMAEAMQRVGLTARENRITPFPVAAWSNETAAEFLLRLGGDCGPALANDDVQTLLALLGDPVPHHLQLVFASLREIGGGSAETLSAGQIHAAFTHAIGDAGGSPEMDTYAERLTVAFPERDMALARFCLGRLCRFPLGLQRGEMMPREYGGERHFPLIVRFLVEEGYISDDGYRLAFRSNLLRQWWERTQIPKSV